MPRKLLLSSGKFSFLGSLSPRARGALPPRLRRGFGGQVGPSACETPPKRKFSPDRSTTVGSNYSFFYSHERIRPPAIA